MPRLDVAKLPVILSRGYPRLLAGSLLLAMAAAEPTAAAAPTGPGHAPAPATSGADVSTDQDEEATRLYSKGVIAANAGRWDEARAAMLESFKRRPLPSTAANLGQLEWIAGRPRDAAEHLTFFLREAQKVSEKDRRATEEMLADAKAKIGSVTIKVNVEGADVLVDGQNVGTSPLAEQVFVEPGSRRIEARKDGRLPASEALEVTPGSAPVVTLTLENEPEPAPALERKPPSRPTLPSRTSPGSTRSNPLIYMLGGATAGLATAGIVTTIATFVIKKESNDDWNANKCNHTIASCMAHFMDQKRQQNYLINTAGWSFIGAGVLGGATTALYMWTKGKAASRGVSSGALFVGPEGGIIAVTGSF